MLNARRHRGGDHGIWTCRSPTARGAQRPEASRRRSRRAPRRGGRRHLVLNARRHRGGDHGDAGRGQRARAAVLNARRHRGGDHFVGGEHAVTGSGCSTPGGIEAAITSELNPPKTAWLQCSTPGGIEAAITARRQPLSNTADFLSFCMHRHTRFGLGRRDAFTPWPNRGRLLRFSSLKLILLSKIADSCGLAPSSPRRVSRSRHRLPVPELAAVPSTRGRSPAPASTLPHDYG